MFVIIDNAIKSRVELEERLHFQELKIEIGKLITNLEILKAHVNILKVAMSEIILFSIVILFISKWL